MISVETAVVGGGPAGAATACGLAASGREVMLFERSSAPHHKVCGEFLSVETQAHLGRLGIDLCALGAAPIGRAAVHAGVRARVVTLPFRALSLSRFRLDEALLQRAAERGARLERGVSIQAVESRKTGLQLRRSDGEVVRCRKLVLATGKLGLRGIADTRDRSMVGLKMHLRLSAESRQALAGGV
jgi:flavin-dependent dehydrogenase